MVRVTVWVTVVVCETVTVRVWIAGAPAVAAPPPPDPDAPPDPEPPPWELPVPPPPECLPPDDFCPDLFLGALGGVPGELPPAGTRLGLKSFVLVVAVPALVLVPVFELEEAVPQPASSAAVARTATDAPARRILGRPVSNERRRGARDGLSVSISTNDTTRADG